MVDSQPGCGLGEGCPLDLDRLRGELGEQAVTGGRVVEELVPVRIVPKITCGFRPRTGFSSTSPNTLRILSSDAGDGR
jgi:hypothetical protein